MFDWGPGEMILILLLVLIVFGAGKLPEVGGALGKALRSFKDSMNGEPDRAKRADVKKIEEKAGEGNSQDSAPSQSKSDE